MSGRKKFIQQIALMGGAFSVSSLFSQLHAEDISSANKKVQHLSPTDVAADEDYWSTIQQAYTVSPNIINLNNGGVSPSPRVVQEALDRYNKLTNEGPSYFMWRILDQGREPLRENLAGLALVIHRDFPGGVLAMTARLFERFVGTLGRAKSGRREF